MPTKTTIGAHLQEWAKAELLPEQYWPVMHPLTAIVAAGERAAREFLARCGPDQSLRWVASRQELTEGPLSIITVTRYEAAGFSSDAVSGLQLWLQARVEELLQKVPNIRIEIVCGS